MMPSSRPARVLGPLLLVPLLAACQGLAGLSLGSLGQSGAASPTATAASSEAAETAVLREARSGRGVDDIVYDAGQMASLPCHSMDFTIMGRCNAAEVDRVAAEIRRRVAAGKQPGIVEAGKLGEAGDDGRTASDGGAPTEGGADEGPVQATPAATAADEAPSTDPGDGEGPRDLGDGVTFDPGAMAAFPCHAMGDTLMGRCSEADLKDLKAQVLERRATAGATATPLALVLPGDLLPAGAEPAPTAAPQQAVELRPDQTYRLRAAPARWRVGGVLLPAYAYNGQIPGPLLKVRQGDEVDIRFENRIDRSSTVHWHGLRLANGSDGVPGVTQPAIQPGGEWVYRLRFADPGLYWYHPHKRDDMQQDAGLQGMILVEPRESGYWSPADQEWVLALDDLLLEGGKPVGYGRDAANFAIMGRFGNRLLVSGREHFSRLVVAGQVIRIYLVNTANVRPFRISFEGAPMKLVGGDLGRVRSERLVEELTLAPAERAVIEVAFDQVGSYRLLHRGVGEPKVLGQVLALPARGAPSPARAAFDRLRVDAEISREMAALAPHRERRPDLELDLTVSIPDLLLSRRPAPEGTGVEDTNAAAATSPGSREAEGDDHAADDAHGPIEWEDDMLAVNRASSSDTVHWMIRDRRTGAVNHELAYTWRVGDIVKVRLRNLGDSDHPMQHPIHFHGQRLLVLSRDGVMERGPSWKDTVLVTPGETVDLLLELTVPGAWMVHCHILEHIESGMMFTFQVLPADEDPPPPLPDPVDSAADPAHASGAAPASDNH